MRDQVRRDGLVSGRRERWGSETKEQTVQTQAHRIRHRPRKHAKRPKHHVPDIQGGPHRGSLWPAHRGGLRRGPQWADTGVGRLGNRPKGEPQEDGSGIRRQGARPQVGRDQGGTGTAARGNIHHVPAGPPQYCATGRGLREPLGDLSGAGIVSGRGIVRSARRATRLPLHRGGVRAIDQADALRGAVPPLQGDHPPRSEAGKLFVLVERSRFRTQDDRFWSEQAFPVRGDPAAGGRDALHGGTGGHPGPVRRALRHLGDRRHCLFAAERRPALWRLRGPGTAHGSETEHFGRGLRIRTL
mmetsp:Transcript_3993/g.11387  ORF Transcript_3993/g.11387 Transcript_3993/m.11387 type:complete len:300 (+) Transcript_3993:2339-3238(+)